MTSFTNFNVFSRHLGTHFIFFRALFLMFTLVSFSILISSRAEKSFTPGWNSLIIASIFIPNSTDEISSPGEILNTISPLKYRNKTRKKTTHNSAKDKSFGLTPYAKNVTTKVGKIFLSLINNHNTSCINYFCETAGK